MRVIYIDMDDVVADWLTHAETVLGRPIPKEPYRIPEDEWNNLKRHERFYRHLPIKQGGKELVEWVTNYTKNNTHVTMGFLTAIPRGNDMMWAPYDKVLWAQDHFPHVPVFFGPYSADKHKHAKPNDILIDDRPTNIADWVKAGGIAHLYREWDDCRIWLEQTLNARY